MFLHLHVREAMQLLETKFDEIAEGTIDMLKCFFFSY
jgi:hypothetical protein